jgi:predicted ATPase
VTLLFTDIEGSTGLLLRLGELYQGVLGRHNELLREQLARHGGVEFGTMGDALFAAFSSPRRALDAARGAQDALAAETWPRGETVRVRIGVHTGRPRIAEHTYWGEDVHYAARIAGAAHGDQVVVSAAAAELVGEAGLLDLGEHRVKDFPIPRRLYQLGAAAHPPLRTLDPLRSNLPSSPGGLIGRQAECAQLIETFRAGEQRLVTITGAGGTGKTRVALEVAEAMVGELTDGAFLISLTEVSAVDGVLGAIASQLRVPLRPDAAPVDAIAGAIGRRQLLLVLDNFEHLLDAAVLVVDLLDAAPGLRVLVTSQAPLRVRGERVSTLGPLAVPAGDDIASLDAAPAGRLLLDRAREAVPDLALTPESAACLARLCRALDGLPLAIELAAARLTIVSPAELLARVGVGIDALGRGPRDLPVRQRGLRAALEWTHGLLGDGEARLLRRLGIFAGPASLERIERICAGPHDQVLDAIAQLWDFSLVIRTGDGRFDLHAAVREYARDKLDESGEAEELARRHASEFAHAAQSWGRRYLFDVAAVQAVVVREQPDIGEALAWAAHHDDDCFARLAGGAAMALLFTARLGPWRERIDAALARETVTGEPRAWLLLAGGLAALAADDAGRAHTMLGRATAAAQESGDAWLACLMLTCSVVLHFLSEATPEVRTMHSALRARVAALGDDAFGSLVEGLEPYLLAYCDAELDPERLEQAQPLFLSLLADRARTDFPARIAAYYWPDCLMARGEHDAALRGYLAALRTARERADPLGIAYQLEGIAISLTGLGRHEESLEAAGWAESARQTAGRFTDEGWKALLVDATDRSRAALEAPAAAAAFARGRALGLDGAVTAALGFDQPSAGAAVTGGICSDPSTNAHSTSGSQAPIQNDTGQAASVSSVAPSTPS